MCRMGTHPSGPALISGQDTTLKEWIQAHPEALGDAVLKRFGTDLPYLFKVRLLESCLRAPIAMIKLNLASLWCLQVLSVQTALSIQSHPDKKLAEKLHAHQPQVGLLHQGYYQP